MQTVYYKIHTSHCALHMAHYILKTAHNTLQYTLLTGHCTLHPAHFWELPGGESCQNTDGAAVTVKQSKCHCTLCCVYIETVHCLRHFQLYCFTFVVFLYISWLTFMEPFPASSWVCDRILKPSLWESHLSSLSLVGENMGGKIYKLFFVIGLVGFLAEDRVRLEF